MPLVIFPRAMETIPSTNAARRSGSERKKKNTSWSSGSNYIRNS